MKILFPNQELTVTGKVQAQFVAGTDQRLTQARDTFTSHRFGKWPVGTRILADFTLDEETGKRQLSNLRGLVETVTEKGSLSGYYISPEIRLALTSAKRMAGKRAVKIMIIGPSGYGKTTIAELFAQALGYGYYRMNCASVRDPEEWFGYREAKAGSTVFIKSELMRKFEDGEVVVTLDEFNRIEPWLHNTLFPLLDHDGRTVVHDEEFAIGPNTFMVATINHGYQYTGTFELDEAMMNRFDLVLEVGPLPHAEETKVLETRTGVSHKDAATITSTANDLRAMGVLCSTRSTLLVAMMVKAGLTLREAFENGVVRRIVEDQTSNLRKSVIDRLNSTLSPVDRNRQDPEDIFADLFGETVVVAKEKTTTQPAPGSYTLEAITPTQVNKVGAIKMLRQYLDLSIIDAKNVVDTANKGEKKWYTTRATFNVSALQEILKTYGYRLAVAE